ncbi:MAG: hypothetical protein N3B18_04085 [Desulfobacterota bacterium]|nr:hypothetical protein [Thermodesulfobacteriota bacterium]
MQTKTIGMITLWMVCCCGGGLFVACTPPPTPRPPVDNNRVFNAGFDAVWAALLGAVTTGEEMLTLTDKTTGLMTFQRNIPVKQLDTYAFDDTGMLMSSAIANVVVRVVEQAPGRTRVAMTTKITATGKDVLDVLLSRQRQVVLDSKGWLEREYFERISNRLHEQPPAL